MNVYEIRFLRNTFAGYDYVARRAFKAFKSLEQAEKWAAKNMNRTTAFEIVLAR